MNGLGINNASKNDKDTAILTPEEVALLRTHARELYSKHLEAMKKLVPEGKKKGKPYGLGVAKILVTVALVLLATTTVISLIQMATGTRIWIEFVYGRPYLLAHL